MPSKVPGGDRNRRHQPVRNHPATRPRMGQQQQTGGEMSIWWGEPPKCCPVCGRFMKVTREPILRVDGKESGEIRTIRECTNKKVDHDLD